MNSCSLRSARLWVEELEPRELPSAAWITQSFDTTAPGSMPTGWAQWSNNSVNTFQVTDGTGFGPGHGLTSNASGQVSARTWMTGVYEKDVQIQADVLLNSLEPLQIFARGQNLYSATPTYYSVSLTRGMDVEVDRVVNGKVTALATVTSNGWVSGEWVRVNLTVQGNEISVQVFRASTAQYLTPDGLWQVAPATAIDLQDSAITGAGRVGLARPAGIPGRVAIDNVSVNASISPGPTELYEQDFNGNIVRGLPAGWNSYTNTTGQSFLETAHGQPNTGSGAISVSGNSGLVARTWDATVLPADVEVSASLALNSLIPAQLFLRGQNLATDSPDYYAVNVTRGATVQLVRVVDGRSTLLGSITTDTWLNQVWVQVSLSAIGSTLEVQIYRSDTGQYLTPNGQWQALPIWAIQKTDSAIMGPGQAGVGRASGGASGSVMFDNFFVAVPPVPNQTGNTRTFNFDAASIGSVPAGWTNWTKGSESSFVVTSESASGRGLNGLASFGGSDGQGRSWFTGQLYSDLLLTGSVYVDGLTPEQLLARGTNLDTSYPTYYAVSLTTGLDVQIVKVVDGVSTVLGSIRSQQYLSNLWVNVGFEIVANTLEAMLFRPDTGQYLTASGAWGSSQAPALSVSDGSITGHGYAGVARLAAYRGGALFDNISFVNLIESVQPVPPTDPTDAGGSSSSGGVTPVINGIPQHYSYIRVAELAYYGTPIGDFENNLLRNSVDLVVANPVYLSQINDVAPNTPQLIYTNVSNLYLNSLTSWLYYANQNRIDPESAFYHVSKATPFSGDSSSSIPVDWFWSIQTGSTADGWSNYTTVSKGSQKSVTFGSAGQATVIGYTDPYSDINISLQQPAANGWSYGVEYVSAVDAKGDPTAWSTLQILSDTTSRMTRSGTINFNPPANWKMAIVNGSNPLYFVRIRALGDGTAPVAYSVLGDDYVDARGGTSGVIPAFDYSADVDHDGYLDAAEYAKRKPGMNARFAYQSRLFYPAYGQMRFATDPSNAAFRTWAVVFNDNYLNSNPLADGLFVDNSIGSLDINPATIKESLSTYSNDYASLLAAINHKISPRWVLANTAGGGSAVNPIIRDGIAYLEEFALRPLVTNWSQFLDTATLVSSRLALSGGKGYGILDVYPSGGAPTDARTEIASLAYYYLVADPTHNFLMLNGGFEPSTTWARHWTAAIKFNVGKPLGTYKVFASGTDPSNWRLTYKIYERVYQNALVLYKPLSYGNNTSGTLADHTATTTNLGGTYRILQYDGTLSAPVTRITLRNGEGAILEKVN
jgi:hypothetical protein